MGHTLVHGDDPSIESFHGVFLKIRRAVGTTAFGINEVRLPPGQEGLEHDELETGHEEVYLVLAGNGVATVDGQDVELAQGDYLRVDASSTRKVVAGPGGLRFVVIGARPQPGYDGRPSL